MAITLTSNLAKASGSIPFLLDSKDLRGGFRTVSDNSERDAISTASRVEGMLVYSIAAGKFFKLGSDTSNSGWAEVDFTSNINLGTGLANNSGAIELDSTYMSNNFAASGHTHAIGDINSLQSALDAKPTSYSGLSDVNLTSIADGQLPVWDNANSQWVNKGTANLGIAISDVASLQSSLDAKPTAYNGLSDVSLTSIADGQLPVWDATNSQWVNKGTDNLGIAISDVASLQTSLNNKAAIGHTHDISDVNSLQSALDAKPTSYSGLSDVSLTSIADGQLPVWDATNSQWVNKGTADLGIAISDIANLQTSLNNAGVSSFSALNDTSVTSPAAGEVLGYDATNSQWINQTLTEAGIAAATHNHDWSEIQNVPQVTSMPGVTVTTTSPTSGDGNNGDIWFVVPA